MSAFSRLIKVIDCNNARRKPEIHYATCCITVQLINVLTYIRV